MSAPARAAQVSSASPRAANGHAAVPRRITAPPVSWAAVTAVRVIGYLTLTERGRAAAASQQAAIERMCARHGWELLETVRDRDRGRVLERPALRYALERIASRNAGVLLVGELRPLSRSTVDLGTLMAWFLDTNATLVALDLPIDTSSPLGRHVATTLVALADWERDRIAGRTRRGLAEVRAHGQPVGRPAVGDHPDLLERIWAMREANMTLRAIADRLNAEQVPTLRGGSEWRPSSIQTALGYRRPGPRDHLPGPRPPARR
jgi:DNA invertase Pin-like site-specific DNA recombinase